MKWLFRFLQSRFALFRRLVRGLRDYVCHGGSVYVTVSSIEHGRILDGKTVLITGGSAGIGLAITKKCLEEGAVVLITGRTESRLADACRTCNNTPRLKTMVWDVSDTGERDVYFRRALDQLGGGLDILVNCAGLNALGTFLRTTEAEWDMVTAVNQRGMFFLSQMVCRHWIENKASGKKIINIASQRGFLGVVDGPYGMSKWGMVGLTRGIGQMLIKHGITVNGIAPGVIADTGMIYRDGKHVDAENNVYTPIPPSYRFGLPSEIAELAIFLMSDAANYIVGQTIVCDGGYSLKQ